MAEKDYNSRVQVPNVDEMNDTDFVRSIDYLASPYYKQYMDAHMRKNAPVAPPVGFNVPNMNQRPYEPTANSDKKAKKVKDKKIKANKNAKVYEKKRPLAMIFIMLFMLIILASVALSSFGLLPKVESYVSTYTYGKTGNVNADTVGLADTVVGAIKKVIPAISMDSVYYDYSLSNLTPQTDVLTQITVYAVSAAALIIILCAISGFIMAIAALSRKAQNNSFKKTGFGFLGLVMFICALILVFAGIFAEGYGISQLVGFMTLSGKYFNAGYALYGYLALPILTMLLSATAYKKRKQ